MQGLVPISDAVINTAAHTQLEQAANNCESSKMAEGKENIPKSKELTKKQSDTDGRVQQQILSSVFSRMDGSIDVANQNDEEASSMSIKAVGGGLTEVPLDQEKVASKGEADELRGELIAIEKTQASHCTDNPSVSCPEARSFRNESSPSSELQCPEALSVSTFQMQVGVTTLHVFVSDWVVVVSFHSIAGA